MNRQALIDLRDAVRAGEHPSQSEWSTAFPDRPEEDDGYPRSVMATSACVGWVDAALHLMGRVLPEGEGWEIYRTAKRPGMIPGSSPFKYAASVGYGRTYTGHADDPARALLLAILEALIEGGSDDQ